MRQRPLSRRTFLRGSGVALSLPLLDAMGVATASAAPSGSSTAPQRLIAIETNQGIVPQYFFPKRAGFDWEVTPYLKHLNQFRDQLTVFSGVSHPEVDGGHSAEPCFLTAAPHPGRGGFRNTISLDQYAAERIGHHNRFPSLTLSINTPRSISFTAAGVQIPGENSPRRVFQKLFVRGNAEAVQSRIADLRHGRSILDSVADRARTLSREVGSRDRAKLDQYFTGVRELERRLHANEEWENRPKPQVDYPMPEEMNDPSALLEQVRSMFDLCRLAVQTDSTRLITFFMYQNTAKPNIPGVQEGTHGLTHHGNNPDKLSQLQLIEGAQLEELSRLLGQLRETPEAGASLLDRTSVLYGTPMGNANRHSNDNLPVLLAGGGFRHAGHLAFSQEHNYPLPNLFVSLLQSLGVEADRFASSTGTMSGLELR
ncbi:DUF1552 domain-containing protein [Stratiformator vulcanicus]|uniref:DUF1552 domain-containing protein n=1 Tax=Stratiformator vulcanicus TaxID=2527980 RepID=A0A517QWR2_9PLAN|nr:DUF1552 domain-containing protein [Stratiformator vulcanicus]QDT36071.1 hypothetical protein Pan189_04260 [Stratiformator vulcanicus]